MVSRPCANRGHAVRRRARAGTRPHPPRPVSTRSRPGIQAGGCRTDRGVSWWICPMSRTIEVNHRRAAQHAAYQLTRTPTGRIASAFAASPAEHQALAHALRSAVAGEVRFDNGSRGLYATDASNYRQVPIGVVIPRTLADVQQTIELCHRHGAPIVARGGGTSLAGQGCNVAVLIDFSKYLNRVLALDPQQRV